MLHYSILTNHYDKARTMQEMMQIESECQIIYLNRLEKHSSCFVLFDRRIIFGCSNRAGVTLRKFPKMLSHCSQHSLLFHREK